MNARDAHALIEKLKALPPQRQSDVEDFVDFLRSREAASRDGRRQDSGTGIRAGLGQ